MNRLTTICLISAALILQGCSLLSKSTKNKEISKIESRESVSTNIDETVRDKSKIVIEESVDTTVNIKPKKGSSEKTIKDLNDIKNVEVLKDNLIDITLNFDKASGVLTTSYNFKGLDVGIKKNKRTEINNDITSNKVSKIDSLAIKDTYNKNKAVDRKYNYTYIVILLLLSIPIYIFIRKFIIRK